MTISSALGPLYAGLALSNTIPVGVVGLGSSSMSAGDQTYENRWFTKFVTHLQALAPSVIGESTVSSLTSATITSPGIHGYNGGQGGTTTRTYLTQERIDRIRDIQPLVVVHLVGSNDYAANITPDEYYANYTANLDKIDAVQTRPYVNIIIHAHRRDGKFAYEFSDYRSVLQTIERQRSNTYFVNVEGPAYAAGIPDRDRYDLLKTDNVHLTTTGHDFFFRVMAEAVTSQSTANSTAPSPADRGPGVMASDSVDVPNYTEIAGRTLDNRVGGYQIKRWEGATKQLCAYYQRLCRLASATANFATVVRMDTPDQELAATLFMLPNGAPVYMAIRRQSNTLSPAPDDYRLVIHPSGNLELVKRVAGGTTVLGVRSTPVVIGDRIAVRAKGIEISVLVNDNPVITATDSSVRAAGYAGFTGLGTTHGFQFEDITFSRV